MLVGFRRFIRAARLLLIVLTLLFVLLLLLLVVGEELLRPLVFRGEDMKQVLAEFRVVEFDARGLIIGPLIIRRRLLNDGRRVGAVRRDRHDRQQDGEDRRLYSDLLARRVGLMFVPVMV